MNLGIIVIRARPWNHINILPNKKICPNISNVIAEKDFCVIWGMQNIFPSASGKLIVLN